MSKKMAPILLSNLLSLAGSVSQAASLMKKTPETMRKIHESLGITSRVTGVYKFFENDDIVIQYIYGIDPGKLMIHDVNVTDGRHNIFIYYDHFNSVDRDDLSDMFNAFKSAVEFVYEIISPTILIKDDEHIWNYTESIRVDDINLYAVVNFCNLYGQDEFKQMLSKHNGALEAFKDAISQVNDVNWLFDKVLKRYEKDSKEKRF